MWPVYARGIAEDFLPALGGNPCEVREMLETIGASCEVARAAEAAAEAERRADLGGSRERAPASGSAFRVAQRYSGERSAAGRRVVSFPDFSLRTT